MIWRGMTLAALLVGCAAEDAGEPAALGELCGVAEPLHLVPLDKGQTVRNGPRMFDGRIYYSIAERVNGDGPTRYDDDVLWSIGPCGEEPRVVAAGVVSTFVEERWPGVLLGCRSQTRDIVSLDPTGATPPHVVFADVDCEEMVRTPHGLVSLGGPGHADPNEPSTLMLNPYPDDPRGETSGPIALADTSVKEWHLTLPYSPIRVIDDAVYHVEAETLMRVGLPDLEETVEQSRVVVFTVSSDGRYLMWQDPAQVNDDLLSPEGPVFLRDRSGGDALPLVPRAALYAHRAPFAFIDEGLVTLQLQNGVTRVFSVPGASFVDLPRPHSLEAVLPDGRWLLQRHAVSPLFVVDPRDLAAVTPVFGDAEILEVREDGVRVREQPDPEVREGPVWLLPFDGSEPRMLAERAGKHYRIDGDRLLTTVDVDPNLLGELVHVDMRTREERRIDTRVGAASFWTDRGLGDELVQYRVYDGERTGVWLVRPPAP